MIANLFLVLFLSIGIGAWLPAPFESSGRPLGLTAFGGFCLMTVSLYVLMVIAGIGFDLSFAVLAAAAVSGLALRLYRGAAEFRSPGVLLNPVVIFPVCIGAVSLFVDPVKFIPYGDDTYINWLTHAKQLWLANHFHSEHLSSSGVGYSPGWHLLMAFTTPVWGEFSDTRVLGLSTAAHVAMWGLIFDILVLWFRQEGFLTGDRMRNATACGIVLLALAAEASWRLVPVLIVPEMPLFYTLIGAFSLFLLFAHDDAHRRRISFLVGLAVCSHYLVKSQGLAAVPVAALGVYLLNTGRLEFGPVRRNAVHAAIVLIPVALVVVSWNLLGPPSPKCVGNLGEILSITGDAPVQGSTRASLLRDVLTATGEYFSSYKLPVTLAALGGLFAGFFVAKLRPVSYLVLLYTGVYVAAVYWTYLSCPHSFGSYLSSILRYLQLPARMLHTIGLLLLALSIFRFVLAKKPLSNSRVLSSAIVGVLIFTGLYQVFQTQMSFSMINRPRYDERVIALIDRIPRDTVANLDIAEERGLKRPRVLMVFRFWEFLPFLVANHSGIASSRSDASASGEFSRWFLEYSRYGKADTEKPAAGVMPNSENLSRYDVVWVLDDIGPVSENLIGLVNNRECVRTPSRFYLVRMSASSQTFDCVRRKTVE